MSRPQPCDWRWAGWSLNAIDDHDIGIRSTVGRAGPVSRRIADVLGGATGRTEASRRHTASERGRRPRPAPAMTLRRDTRRSFGDSLHHPVSGSTAVSVAEKRVHAIRLQHFQLLEDDGSGRVCATCGR